MSQPSRARASVHALLPLALVAVVACAGSSAQDPTDDAPVLPRLEPVATFGCAECEGPELLAQPGVTVGASGRVYVHDNVEPFLRVLESDGELLLTLGKGGEGPGEIRMPFPLGVLEEPDGSFWLHEPTFLHRY